MTTTVIPVKPATGAKGRLAPVLSPDARADLARALLGHTVDVALTIGPVLVVSASPRMRAVAAGHGATPVVETGHGLNDAVSQGLERAGRDGAERALVLPADLPMLTPEDLAGLVAVADGTGLDRAGVVVVPCQREEGTNALLLALPTTLRPRFGPDSFRRHVAAARAAGLSPTVHRSDGFVDLDLPEDWRRHGAGSVTRAPQDAGTSSG